jgi:tetratricopeptide (TPR) repeat protein
LAEAVGGHGQLIVDLIPQVEFIIGKQPPVLDLPSRDAQSRFQLVLRRFLGAFARREHPLALFLDDLQWIDAATLDLLEHLVTHSEVQHLLVVGAYRDNEVSSSHPLTRMLDALRKARARIQEIVLVPLRLDDVDQLVADALHCERDAAHPLAQLVHDKTGGNPFFAIQSLTALADEGLLWFDPVMRAWQWDMNRIHAKGYTDNEVDLMIGKLKRFSATTQEVLEHLACLGDVGEVTTLALVHLKLQAQFLAGDHAEALVSADKAKALLWASAVQIQLLDYFYYDALTVAASYENGSADEQQAWRELLRAHQEQLREWAENNPPTFADKLALVSAEIARIEKRDTDAMHLYEQAIKSAREHGFVQNEALSYEVAARFYLARGLETVAYAYLRNARNCYERWGALSKVKQLDECYPQLHEERNPISPIATIGSSVGQLDVETVVKASQALSSEIVLPKLIEKLLRIAVEHAGAERGLLILLRGDEPQIEAEATTAHGSVEVTVRQAPVTPSDLPQSALHYVIRTRERVVLDDASVGTL